MKKPANPFVSLNSDDILSDLSESRKQFSEGKGIDMEDALNEIGKQHGFL